MHIYFKFTVSYIYSKFTYLHSSQVLQFRINLKTEYWNEYYSNKIVFVLKRFLRCMYLCECQKQPPMITPVDVRFTSYLPWLTFFDVECVAKLCEC